MWGKSGQSPALARSGSWSRHESSVAKSPNAHLDGLGTPTSSWSTSGFRAPRPFAGRFRVHRAARKGVRIVAHPLRRRTIAATTGALLSLLLVGSFATSAAAAPTVNPASAAAGWRPCHLAPAHH